MKSPPVLLGTTLPDVDVWSRRVAVALGQNPSVFTGPGTNAYLLGTGRRRILLDPGQGVEGFLPVLEKAMEKCGCEGFQEIVLTHGHPDHLGGVHQVRERFGPLRVSKMPWPEIDERAGIDPTPLRDGDRIEAEGITLRALHTPGHAPDHLCFVIEEERALISGDNVLGVGTTVIPTDSGDLADYMASLERMLAVEPRRIYPAHGPCIEDGTARIEEYIAHRREREQQIIEVLRGHSLHPIEIVRQVYAAYPESLHAAAAQSVTQHLLKLERERRARREDGEPTGARWRLS